MTSPMREALCVVFVEADGRTVCERIRGIAAQTFGVCSGAALQKIRIAFAQLHCVFLLSVVLSA